MPSKHSGLMVTPQGGTFVSEQEEFLEWVGLGDYRGEIINPFNKRTQADIEHPDLFLLKMMRQPKYFYFTVKHLFGMELYPFQCLILQEMWNHPFPMLIGSRGMGKSTILGIYALLRATLIQGRKVMITGSGFRQSKAVFEYAEKCYQESEIFRGICRDAGSKEITHGTDMWRFPIGDSLIMAIPIGNGEKIRGLRANDVIADEYKSMEEEIFERVIQGFTSVNLDPVKQSRALARERVLARRGYDMDKLKESRKTVYLRNQTIISGTAYYQFNHFYKKFMFYKDVIESEGDHRILRQLHNGKEPGKHFDHKSYAIIRMPVDMIPEGMMAGESIDHIRSSVHESTYNSEYGCVFPADSAGFFKRSIIESCVTRKPIMTLDGPVQFQCLLQGDTSRQYIYGIDPASDKDNLAIVILEVHDNHRRVVYVWTTNKKDHINRQEKRGIKIEADYNRFCVRKIRDLMKIFPARHIAIDMQGGGKTFREALGDPDKLNPGEYPIYQCTPDMLLGGKEEKKDKFTDRLPGLHILELVQPSDAAWVAAANHDLRKDLESTSFGDIYDVKTLLFPHIDAITLSVAWEDDQRNKRDYDTLEDCYEEIEELKNEMATIVLSNTPSGREHFDTPEGKTEGMKKGRMHKDRYSALLMANAAARKLTHHARAPEYVPMGGFVGTIPTNASNGSFYQNSPEWFGTKMGDYSCYGVVRKDLDQYGNPA